MVAVDYDPIARGYVAGLARPGGNITGVFLQQVELSAKRIEIMKETFPRVTRAAASETCQGNDADKVLNRHQRGSCSLRSGRHRD